MSNTRFDLSAVPKEALPILEQQGFVCHNSCGMYVDFRKEYKEGWGEDGTDRVETISYDVDAKAWYGAADHRDLDGHVWYETESMKCDGSLGDAFRVLTEDRKEAPKKFKPRIYPRR